MSKSSRASKKKKNNASKKSKRSSGTKAATTANSAEADQLYAKGAALHGQGELHGARGYYERCLKYNPKHADALHMLGVIEFQKGRFLDGIPWIQKSLEIAPNNHLANFNLGFGLQSLRRFDEACASYRIAYQHNPNHLSALSNLGCVYIELNDYAKAKEVLRRALEVDPKRVDVLNNLGLALIELKVLDEARLCFEALIKIAGPNANAFNSIGSILQKQGDLEGAVAYYKQSLALEPLHYDASLNLATAFTSLSKHAAALEYYHRGMELNPGCIPSVIGAAVQYCLLNDFDRMSKHLHVLENRDFAECPKDKRSYALGYFRFLKALSEHRKNNPRYNIDFDQATPHLDIVGDSHCLSYAHTKVLFQGVDVKVKPHLIVGCKAWHLASQSNNEYKASFNNAVDVIDEGSSVLFVFGEIDCRLNEGLLRHAKQKQVNLEDLVATTVQGFIEKIKRACERRSLVPFILNVAAPLPHTSYSEADKASLIEVVALFNKYLNQCSLGAFKIEPCIIDLYSLTKDHQGLSSGEYHLDDVHLAPEALVKALELSGFTHCDNAPR